MLRGGGCCCCCCCCCAPPRCPEDDGVCELLKCVREAECVVHPVPPDVKRRAEGGGGAAEEEVEGRE